MTADNHNDDVKNRTSMTDEHHDSTGGDERESANMPDDEIQPIEECLRHWKRLHCALEAEFGALNALTGAMPNCKLMTPIFDIWEAYTAEIGKRVGDKAQWLDWFQHECKMGKRPLTVAFDNGEEIKVSTIKQLARVIAFRGTTGAGD